RGAGACLRAARGRTGGRADARQPRSRGRGDPVRERVPLSAPGLGFSLARVLLGLHLAVSFGALTPHAAELFGPTSIFGARAAIPFPNLFDVVHSAGQAQVILVVLTAASLALAAGLARR